MDNNYNLHVEYFYGQYLLSMLHVNGLAKSLLSLYVNGIFWLIPTEYASKSMQCVQGKAGIPPKQILNMHAAFCTQILNRIASLGPGVVLSVYMNLINMEDKE